jgi:hypothetical protein
MEKKGVLPIGGLICVQLLYQKSPIKTDSNTLRILGIHLRILQNDVFTQRKWFDSKTIAALKKELGSDSKVLAHLSTGEEDLFFYPPSVERYWNNPQLQALGQEDPSEDHFLRDYLHVTQDRSCQRFWLKSFMTLLKNASGIVCWNHELQFRGLKRYVGGDEIMTFWRLKMLDVFTFIKQRFRAYPVQSQLILDNHWECQIAPNQELVMQAFYSKNKHLFQHLLTQSTKTSFDIFCCTLINPHICFNVKSKSKAQKEASKTETTKRYEFQLEWNSHEKILSS